MEMITGGREYADRMRARHLIVTGNRVVDTPTFIKPDNKKGMKKHRERTWT